MSQMAKHLYVATGRSHDPFLLVWKTLASQRRKNYLGNLLVCRCFAFYITALCGLSYMYVESFVFASTLDQPSY